MFNALIKLITGKRQLKAVTPCKSCKYWEDDKEAGTTERFKLCTINYYLIKENGYCNYSEEKEA